MLNNWENMEWNGLVTEDLLPDLPVEIKTILLKDYYGKKIRLREGHMSGIYYTSQIHGFLGYSTETADLIFHWDVWIGGEAPETHIPPISMS